MKSVRAFATLSITAWLLATFGPGLRLARADDVVFTAQPDRTSITQDDSVSIKFSIRSQGSGTSSDGLSYQAPDFDEVNEYSGVYVESYYENGHFGIRNNRQITKVLRPKRTGDLKIAAIHVSVGGKTYVAPDITIHVESGGAGTPPPQGYGGGAGGGLSGAGKHVSGVPFFVKAELNKQRIYKGEQVIVSYYLYRRARVFNIQVDKYPTLSGFLREDLDMPVLGQRLDSEQVVLDGIAYERSLLVRYAAYPLKTGKLTIDPMQIKADYYGKIGNLDDDEEDPFLGFFRQIAPRESDSSSDPVTLDILPLPEDGKPADFAGAVGNFKISAKIDKQQVDVNQPVTLDVTVQGQGNLAALDPPKGNWPKELELYESKGQAKSGHGGVGQKTFEYLLIPRASGKVTIPPLSFSFFDPSKKTYVSEKTDSFDLDVQPGASGSNPPPSTGSPSSGPGLNVLSQSSQPSESLGDLKPPGAAAAAPSVWESIQGPLMKFGLDALALALLLAGLGLGIRGMRRRITAIKASESRRRAAHWAELQGLAKRAAPEGRAQAPWNEIVQGYERLSGLIYDAIDRVVPVGARSMAREDLGLVLTDGKHLSPDQWLRCAGLLEYAETVRYALAAGPVTEDMARREFRKWVDEGKLLEDELSKL